MFKNSKHGNLFGWACFVEDANMVVCRDTTNRRDQTIDRQLSRGNIRNWVKTQNCLTPTKKFLACLLTVIHCSDIPVYNMMAWSSFQLIQYFPIIIHLHHEVQIRWWNAVKTRTSLQGEMKYGVCENLQTPNTNRMLEQSCSHDILSLIYHGVQ